MPVCSIVRASVRCRRLSGVNHEGAGGRLVALVIYGDHLKSVQSANAGVKDVRAAITNRIPDGPKSAPRWHLGAVASNYDGWRAVMFPPADDSQADQLRRERDGHSQ